MNIEKIKIGKPINIKHYENIFNKQSKEEYKIENFSIDVNNNRYSLYNVEVTINNKQNKMILIKKNIDHRIAMHNGGIFIEYILTDAKSLKIKNIQENINTFFKQISKFITNNNLIKKSSSTVIYI